MAEPGPPARSRGQRGRPWEMAHRPTQRREVSLQKPDSMEEGRKRQDPGDKVPERKAKKNKILIKEGWWGDLLSFVEKIQESIRTRNREERRSQTQGIAGGGLGFQRKPRHIK